MWRRAFPAALALLAAAPAAQASVHIEGVEFARSHRVGGRVLELRGVGLLRYRWVLKGYVAALYLDARAADGSLLEAPRRLEIEYFWAIPAAAFAKATLEGVARNTSPAEAADLAERLERFNRGYEDVVPGDRYALTYVPGEGTELALNGAPKARIEGADAARALFDIWLGANPLDRELRAQLLGVR